VSVNGKNECGGGILSVLHLGVSVLKSSKFGNWKLQHGLRQGGVGIGMPDWRLVGRSSHQARKKKWTSPKIMQKLGMKSPNNADSLK